jgi:hypothetical protein
MIGRMIARCLYKRGAEGEETAAAVTAADERDRAVICARCRHDITSESARIEVAGRHRHTCVNPAGVVYRIACFRAAAGCAPEGGWSDFFSWFAGCSWQIAVCARCQAHLGWGFRGESEGFFGLIEERLETT